MCYAYLYKAFPGILQVVISNSMVETACWVGDPWPGAHIFESWHSQGVDPLIQVSLDPLTGLSQGMERPPQTQKTIAWRLLPWPGPFFEGWFLQGVGLLLLQRQRPSNSCNDPWNEVSNGTSTAVVLRLGPLEFG